MIGAAAAATLPPFAAASLGARHAPCLAPFVSDTFGV